MPDLLSVKRNCARLDVEYGPASLVVFYRPVEVDDQTHAALVGMHAAGELGPFYAELERLVVAWDLTADGQPVPTDAAGFRRAGVGICGKIINAILADVSSPTWGDPPSPGPQTPWSNGSSPTAGSDSPSTTTASSSPPNGWASHPGPSPDSTTPLAVPGGSRGLTASDVP